MTSKARRILGLLAGSLLVANLFLASTPARAVHDFNPLVFELDGNVANPGGADDWARLQNSLGSAQAKTGVLADPHPNSIFTTGGSKDDNNIPQWRHKNGSVPDKDDITNAYAAAYIVNGQLVIYAGLDRIDNSGDAFAGFWFFQENVGLNANGTFSGTHRVGDLLVLANFTGGGQTVTIQVLRWVGSGGNVNGTLQLVASSNAARCVQGMGAHDFCGITNETAGEIPPWPYVGKGVSAADGFPVATFYEVGINISALFPGNTPCFASFMAETRSSSSVSATLKDFALGGFPVCDIAVTKTCPSGELVDGGTAIQYTVQGAVTNTGFGSVTNVTVTDNPALDSMDFYNCSGGQPTGSPVSFNGTLAGGASICYRGVFKTTENGTSDVITASASVGNTTITKTAPATCNPIQIISDMTLSKNCKVVLQPTGNAIQLKVEVDGTVCNTGQVPLTSVSLTDAPPVTFTQQAATTLAVGACSDYKGSYIPSVAENRLNLGQSTTVPGLAKFNDTMTATAVASGLGGGQQRETSTNATCNLCPTCSPDACTAQGCSATEPTSSSSTLLRSLKR